MIPENSPLAPHTYDGLVWNSTTQTLWLTNTGIGFASDLGSPHAPTESNIWEFDPATGDWTAHASDKTFYRSSSVFIESTDEVLVLSNNKYGEVSPTVIDSDGGTTHGDTTELETFSGHSGRIDASLFENPLTGTLYQARKNGITQLETTTDANGDTVAISGASVENAPTDLHQAGFAFNTDDGNFYIWNGDREIIRWDVGDEADLSDDTFETLYNVAGDAPSGDGSSKIFDKFVYLEELNAFAGIQNVEGDEGGVWLYKPGENGDQAYQTNLAGVTFDAPTNHAIHLHVDGSNFDVNGDGSVEVSYRLTGTADWQPAGALVRNSAGEYSGSVLNLQSGSDYEVKLDVLDPDGLVTDSFAGGTFTVTTSSRPAAMTEGNEIRVNSMADLQAAVDGAQGGDNIVLEDGTYVGNLNVKSSGTSDQPIVIRAAEGADSIIDAGGNGAAVRIEGDFVHLEGLTIRNASHGIQLRDGRGDHVEGAVIRNNSILDVDRGIDANEGHRDITITDNYLVGRNAIGDTSSDTWGDEGIVVTGEGIEVAYNTIAGFGDSLGLNHNTDLANRAIAIHHNKVLWGGDDGIELDFTDRNVIAHDNLLMNTANGISFQYVDNGPATAYKNLIYNVERGPFKIKPEADTNEGVRLYNNTSIKSGEAWKDFSGNPVDTHIVNNLFVGDGQSADTVRADTTIFDDLTMDFNAWSYDGRFQVGGVGTFGDFAAWQAGSQGDNDQLLEGEAIFAGLSLAEATAAFSEFREADLASLVLADVSSALDAGTVIHGVTDGYVGAAPDIGALEKGAVSEHYGTRNAQITRNAPIAGADEVAAEAATAVVIDPLANDIDLQGGQLQLVSVAMPSAGTSSITSDSKITYQPADGFVGEDSFTYKVADADGNTATGKVIVTVQGDGGTHGNTPPLAADDSVSGVAGEMQSISVDTLFANDSDADGDPLKVSGVSSAQNGTVRLSDGIVTFTPDGSSTTEGAFVYHVSDGDGGSATARVSIEFASTGTVAGTDYRDTIDLSNKTDGQAVDARGGHDVVTGSAFADDITGGTGDDQLSGGAGNDVFRVDGDAGLDQVDGGAGVDRLLGGAGDDLIGLRDLAGIEIIDGGAGTNRIMGTSTRDRLDLSTTEIRNIAVIDGAGGHDILTGSAGNDFFRGGAGADQIAGGAGVDMAVFDGNYADYTVTQKGGNLDVAALVSDESTDKLNGIEVLQFKDGQWQNGTFTAGANGLPDGGGETTPSDTEPEFVEAVDDTGSLAEDGSLSLDVLANDMVPSGTTVQDITVPEHGTAVLEADGGVTYTPDVDFNGADGFAYSLLDAAGNVSTATVGIEVMPVNDAPVVVDDQASMEEGDKTVVDVLANDTDIDGDTLTLASVTAEGGGKTTFQEDGQIVYTAEAGSAGTHRLSYTVEDGQGGGATGELVIDVTAAVISPTQTFTGIAYRDKVDLSGAAEGYIIDTLGGHDIVTGTVFADHIYGGGGDDQLAGGSGDDIFFGAEGLDTIDGGAGVDILQGLDGDDLFGLRGFASLERIDGGGGSDAIRSTGSRDRLDFSDTELVDIELIDGGGGHDIVTGSQGDDHFIGRSGSDRFDGGAGYDIAYFEESYADYQIEERNGEFRVKALMSDEGQDKLANVEALRFDDGVYEDGQFQLLGVSSPSDMLVYDNV
ncbi:Ig-like domain-containing protein [Rhodovibrio salinarum]|nr:Ig-like domain-containing protein [Rhodovibrio salinarum]